MTSFTGRFEAPCAVSHLEVVGQCHFRWTSDNKTRGLKPWPKIQKLMLFWKYRWSFLNRPAYQKENWDWDFLNIKKKVNNNLARVWIKTSCCGRNNGLLDVHLNWPVLPQFIHSLFKLVNNFFNSYISLQNFQLFLMHLDEVLPVVVGEGNPNQGQGCSTMTVNQPTEVSELLLVQLFTRPIIGIILVH